MISSLSTSNLAYIGDALLSLKVRVFLIEEGLHQPTKLLQASNRFVSAESQARFMKVLLSEKLLDEEELNWYKRGRNHKSRSVAKNASIISYRIATGFEVLIGFWYYQNPSRFDEIFQIYCEEVKSQYGPVYLW